MNTKEKDLTNSYTLLVPYGWFSCDSTHQSCTGIRIQGFELHIYLLCDGI